ncbi:MAG: hypothetical protein ACRDSR_12265 [Pseudonocardiaceae bacterium]
MSGRDDGSRDDPRAGHPNGHPNLDRSELPADLAAIQADDLLLDLLGGAGRVSSDVDDVDGELTRVLVAWRREVHADSNRLLVDADTALSVISAARRPIRRRSPIFGPVAAAAAVLVIAFSSVGLLAKSAHPGDNLWPVTETLYSDYALSVETAARVRIELDLGKKALHEGKLEEARASVETIRQLLPVVADAQGKADLATQQRDLERELPPVEPPPPPAPSLPVAPPLSPSPAPTTPPDATVSPVPSPSSPVPSPSSPLPEPTPSPSPEPAPSPSPSPDTSPSPTPEEPTPTPEPTTPPAGQSNQPSAKPIGSSPSGDFTPPEPPKPPTPPSPTRPVPPDPPDGPGDAGSSYRGPVQPGQPRVVSAVQPPPSPAMTASAYPRQYSQLT